MKLSGIRLAALLSTAAVFSCSDPICGCSPALPYAYISGQVRDAEGVPVSGATIRARVGNAACEGPYRTLEVYPATTQPSGEYRASLLGYGATGLNECMQAWAEPPAGAAARASEAVQFAVRFTTDSRADSVRVDLELRPVEQELTLWVAPNDVACTGAHPMRCLLVRENPEAAWTNFYTSIEGFTWEPGYTYQLRVLRTIILQPLPDQSAARYRLLQVLDKR